MGDLKRLALLAITAVCVPGFAAPVDAGDSLKYNLKIDKQPLSTALQEFATQSGVQIIFFSKVTEGHESPALKGKYTAADAIAYLLNHSDLTFQQLNPKTIEIQPKAAINDLKKDSSASFTQPQVNLHAAQPSAHDAGQDQESHSSDSSGPIGDSSGTTAQSSQDDKDADSKVGEVIVTGTLIRGIEPAGASVISMDTQAIVATGAASTNDVLRNIPQMAEFGNTNARITAVNFQVTVDRPNIRNLPGIGTNGGSTTLVLVDGHRLVGEGVKETAPDPNTVPPALLERVEVLPDGGSSTYGSDAIGGVINFITKRHFDGVQVDGRYGFAGAYKSYNADATLGRDWGTGSAYVAYSYSDNTPLFGYDRSYVRKYNTSGGANPDVTCTPGNVAVTSGTSQTTYAMPGLLPNTVNNCDTSRNASFFAREIRNSVFAGLSQDISDSVKFDLRSYYSNQTSANLGELTSSGTITAANPYYTRTADNPAPQAPNIELAEFAWDPVLGPQAARTQTTLTSWGVTPTFTFDVGGGWQVREMTNYGGSRTFLQNPGINPTALTQALGGTTTATALNPYNLASTNPAVLANVSNYELYGISRQRLINERIVGDGAVLLLPGGEVHVAVGGEYINEHYQAKQANLVPGTESSIPYTNASRTSYAGFGEMNIPIIGEHNSLPGVVALNLNASARYDHYSDFGGTTNPKVALTYEPLDWIKIRGNWGTSFNAPSLADTAAVDNSIFEAPAIVFPSVLPGQFSPSQALNPLIFAQGGLPNLGPQTAHTYEIGTDISPPAVPGFKFSLTYYHINFNDILSTPNVSFPIIFWTYYKNSYTLSPSNAQVLALASQVPGGPAIVAPYLQPGAAPIYAIIDDRRRNLGNAKIGGLDLALHYTRPTDFGSIDASFNGSYDLQADNQPLAGLPFVDSLAVDASRFRFSAAVGANVGDLRAQATLNYVAGFDNTPTPANNNQSFIRAFTVVDLFLRYDLSHVDFKHVTDNMAVTLSINNVFDQNPPLYTGTYNSNYNGYANGATVGRFVQLGVSKKF